MFADKLVRILIVEDELPVARQIAAARPRTVMIRKPFTVVKPRWEEWARGLLIYCARCSPAWH